MKLLVFKIDKTESKNFNEEEHGQSEKGEFETLDRPISVLWQAFLENLFFTGWVILSCNVLSEIFFDCLLD